MKLYARWIEFALLFVGIPVVLVYTEDIVPVIPTILILLAVVIIILRSQGWQYSDMLTLGSGRSWRNMLLVFAVSAVAWTVITYLWRPDLLFSFPLQRPDIWIFVMALYPIVSALPQEILYRTYFFHRYGALFAHQKWVMIVVSGLVFMWGHLLFMNAFALSVTLLGGMVFAWRYYHTRSLLLVAVEHGLYGNLFFTLGLGQFLFSGMV